MFELTKAEFEYLKENAGLTDQEQQILALLRRGWSQDQIADECFVCRRTVVTRVKSIKKKIIRCITK